MLCKKGNVTIIILILLAIGLAGSTLFFYKQARQSQNQKQNPSPVPSTSMDDKDPQEVKNLITNFERGLNLNDHNSNFSVQTYISFFTSPKTQKEKEERDSILGNDKLSSGLWTSNRTSIGVSSYEIVDLKKVSDSKYAAVVKEQIIHWSVSPDFSGYLPSGARTNPFVIVKESGKWLIDSYGENTKYLGIYGEPLTSSLYATSPTPQTIISIPSDWKTYKNSTYGFSFKYPNNVTVKEASPVYVSLVRSTSNNTFDLQILFFVGQNPDGLSRRQYFAKDNNLNPNDPVSYKYFNIREVFLGKLNALRIIEDAEAFKQSSLPYTNYLVSSGKIMYMIVTVEYAGKFNGTSTEIDSAANASKEIIATTQQILSTLSF